MIAELKGFYVGLGSDKKDDGREVPYILVASGKELVKVKHCKISEEFKPGTSIQVLCNIRQVLFEGRSYLVVNAITEKGGYADE